MSCASLALSPLKPSRNFLVPERAIVPRLSMTSSWLMPMPLSLTVSVPAAASGIKVTDITSAPIKPGFAMASKRSFSQASEAFEINSRRKISLCEYSEWITNRKTCLVSAWNSLICGCVSVVMALQSVCFTGSLRGACLGSCGASRPILQDSLYAQDRKFQDGEERHQCGCLGGAGGQCARCGDQIRGRRGERIGRHAERGGAFPGR